MVSVENDGSSSHDDDDDLPAAAASATTRLERGWQGSNMELEHQREMSLRVSGDGKQSTPVAVDLLQFHNTQVGQGYQAKHVIRQPGSDGHAMMVVKDMTVATTSGKATAAATTTTSNKRPRDASGTSTSTSTSTRTSRTLSTPTKLQKYLSSPGFRWFREEVEDLLR